VVLLTNIMAGELNLDDKNVDFLSDTNTVTVAEYDISKILDFSTVNMDYNCITQPNISSSIYVGWNGEIGLWDKDSIIHFCIRKNEFPTQQDVLFSTQALINATNSWNSKNIGVKFQFTTDINAATFMLTYGGDKGNVLASAFFPNSPIPNALFVYKLAFQPQYKNNQSNIFQHELGHVIGLRHEFAPQEGVKSTLFGPLNPQSVMSYIFPPNIQQSDVDSTKLLYTKDGSIGGFPIKRHHPK